MNQQRYETYKDSGILWLGEIPAHWERKRIKAISSLNDETLDENTNAHFEIKYLDISNVTSEGYMLGVETMDYINAPSRARRRVKSGDTVVSTVRTYLKAIAFIKNPPNNFIVSTGFTVLRPFTKTDGKYLYYFTRSQKFVDTVVAYSKGVSYPAISPTELGALSSLLPPLPEQHAIAVYLDERIAKLDKLIANKREQVKQLETLRKVTIHDAVTKGLNPDAPMKDSGIPWLGEIPAHWEVTCVKRKSKRLQTGTTPPTSIEKYYVDGSVPWHGPSSFGSNLIMNKPTRLLSKSAVDDGVARLFEAGSTMIITIGATIGKVGFLSVDASSNQQITAITFGDQCFAKFAAYQLKKLEPVISGISPNTTLPILDQVKIGQLPLIVPPLSEQQAIAAYLDKRTANLDQLISNKREQIKQIETLRKVTIHDAVTGNINVSGLGI